MEAEIRKLTDDRTLEGEVLSFKIAQGFSFLLKFLA